MGSGTMKALLVAAVVIAVPFAAGAAKGGKRRSARVASAVKSPAKAPPVEPAPASVEVALAEPAPAPVAATVDTTAAAETTTPDPWRFDFDLGLPAFDGGSKIAFDVEAGYGGETAGGDASYAMSSYSLASGDGATATTRSVLAANAWYLTGTPGSQRWEGRAELEKVDYAGISVDSGGGGGSATSLFRLVALGGYHSGKDREMPFRLAAGIGIQNESNVTVSDTGGSGAASWGTRFVLRGALERDLFPGTARLRAETELATLSLTKLAVGPSSSIQDVFGVESQTRLHADLVKYAFLGFTPDAFIGLDVVALDSASAFVPLFGVGLIR